MIKANKTVIIFLYLITFIFILWGYYKYIVPNYGYTGFKWCPNQDKIIESVVILLIVVCFLPCKFKKISDLLLHIHFLFPVLPMLVLYGVSDQPSIYFYASVIAFLLLIFFTKIIRLTPIYIVKISPLLLLQILVALSWLTVISIILFGGLRYLNFNLSKVYEVRSNAASLLPVMFGYITPLITKSIIPFAVLLSILLKNRIYLLMSIATSIMMFGLTAHKGPIFYPLTVLMIYYVLTKKNVIIVLLLSSLLLIIISLIDFMLGGVWVGSLILRRIYLLPALLNFVYYDFFSSNLFTLWSQSKITFGLINYPYPLDTSHLIGRNYYDSDLMGANTGWIGSGYMNAGFTGMFVYSIIIGFLFSLMNAYGRIINEKIIISIMIIPLITIFFASDLPNSFLNHGIILSMFLISILPKSKKNENSTFNISPPTI